MRAVKAPRLTVEAFLAWEALQEEKWELVDGLPVPRVTRLMAGGTFAHARIAANVIIALGPQLRSGPCAALTADIKVRADRAVRYADVTVDCGTAPGSLLAQTPRVMFEVLSPSNDAFQQNRLLADYQSIDTVEQVVFLNQDAAFAQSWRRVANGWTLEEYEGLEAEIPLPTIGADLRLAAAYDGLPFGPR